MKTNNQIKAFAVFFLLFSASLCTEAGNVNVRNGSVGIGTNNPWADLHINSSDNWGGIALTSNETTTGFYIATDGGNAILWNDDESNMSFATNNIERMRIDSSGSVGIGTTSPVQKLDIRSTSTVSQFHVNSVVANNAGGYLTAIDPDIMMLSGGTWWNGTDWVATATGASIIAAYGMGVTFFTNVSLTPGSKYTPIERMRIDTAGNVGIGTIAAESRLQVTGGGLCVGTDANCNSDNNAAGVVYSSSTAMTVYDVAENYPTKENLSEGDVLVLDPDNAVHVKRSGKAYDTLVVGVFSANPAVLLGGFNGAQFKNETQAAVALTGRVPVKVTNANGPIRIGDLLTTSPAPGTAMRCGAYCGPGTVLGKALENFNDSEGKILALMTLQ